MTSKKGPVLSIKRAVQGSTLIEVMVAMFVLAVGILGAGAMQTMGLQANRGAYLRSQAIYLASDMMDRIRENRTARAAYVAISDTRTATVKGMSKPACTAQYAGCTANDIATADIVAWSEKLNTQKVLPDGYGQITSLPTGDNIRITISWKENEWTSTGRAEDWKTYVLVAAVKKEVL
jgi:type IV pilus assembly protein PilV